MNALPLVLVGLVLIIGGLIGVYRKPFKGADYRVDLARQLEKRDQRKRHNRRW